jgi:sugar lactone lactonase YvrE
VLIGLNPTTTLFTIGDDEPNFKGEGEPVPLLDSAVGGATVLTGIGVVTGGGGPRTGGVVWRAGARSMIEDVNFPAGRSFFAARLAAASGSAIRRPPQPPAPVAMGSQQPSLWIRDGGGGLIRDVWTANTAARAGWRIENTTTPGIAYQVSCEHHPKNEVMLVNAANWTIYALQTEEEVPAGAEATAVELDHARDVTFVNLFDYRVSRNVMPKIAAMVSRGSDGVRIENMHSFSQTRLAFDNSVIDETSGVAVRTHDFTSFSIGSGLYQGAPLALPTVFERGTKLSKLAGDFSNATGLTASPDGRVFFTDAVHHGVYRWDEGAQKAVVLSGEMEAPQVAGFVGPSTVMVVDNGKRVFAVPADGSGKAQQLEPGVATEKMTLLLPVGLHESLWTLEWLVRGRGYVYSPRSNMAVTALNEHEPRTLYFAPGTTTAILGAGAPGAAPVTGPRGAVPSVGTWKPDLQAMQLAEFAVGDSHLVASEEDDKVYWVRLESIVQLTSIVFAPRGGTSVVEDAAGNVYVAGAQVWVYDSTGKLTGTLEMPERPTSLTFGGTDGKTLFIGARSGLYGIRTAVRGTGAKK